MAAQTRETGEGFLAEVSVEILKAGKLASLRASERCQGRRRQVMSQNCG